MSGQEGTAFILTNDAMPGFVRFEYTVKDDLANKIRKINDKDLPIPFRLYYAAKVPDCESLDRNLHYLFSDHCDARDSRFFRMNPDMLRAAIELAATTTVNLSDEELGISPQVRARMEQIKASHDASRFGAFSAKPDTTLYFSKDTSITCTALDNGMVQYEGETVTPQEATLRALHRIGFDWSEVSATDYWVRHEFQPSNAAQAKASSSFVFDETQHVPVARNDADESPVMFIRNRKI